MKRFIDYRTLDKEGIDFLGNELLVRNKLEVSTSTFQNLTEVISALSRWYEKLEILKIENIDFRKEREEQQKEMRGKRRKKEEDDTMPF